MVLRRNKKFKCDYDRLFLHDPEAANLYLLLCELADKKGRVVSDARELAELFQARFNDPAAYQLKCTGGSHA